MEFMLTDIELIYLNPKYDLFKLEIDTNNTYDFDNDNDNDNVINRPKILEKKMKIGKNIIWKIYVKMVGVVVLI